MSYFDQFQQVSFLNYNVVNITQRVAFFEEIRQSDIKSSDYIVQDGESPQSLAQDFYGDPKMDWTIILMNKIVDPFYDWHMDTNIFETYLQERYPIVGGIPGADVIAGYVLPDNRFFQANGNIGHDVFVSDILASGGDPSAAYPVTFRDYEEDLNEKKRTIRIIQPSSMGGVLVEFSRIMKLKNAI